MFLHYMARYLSIHNESIYERTNVFDMFKPLNMRTFMELLDELLILNVYGNEDDSEDESEDETQPQETTELDNVNQKITVQQHEDDSTPKGRRFSRRPRNQRIEKPNITTTTKKINKSAKRTNATKKIKVNTSSILHTCTADYKEIRIKREDPYLLWLTAVMLKKIDRCDEAIELLVKAIRLQPCHWGAWIELSTLVKDIKMVITNCKHIYFIFLHKKYICIIIVQFVFFIYIFRLLFFQFEVLNSRLTENNDTHWMHLLFIAHVFIDFQMTDRAVDIYYGIFNFGHIAFHNWPYLHSQLAVAYHNKRGKNGKGNFYLFNYIISCLIINK